MRRVRGSLAGLPCVVGLLPLAAAGSMGFAAGTPAVLPLAELSMLGGEPQLTLELGAGKAVALQLDLVYDPRILEVRGGTASAATVAAGKQFTVRHLAAGRARVVVFGANLDPLPAGALGTVTFHALRRAVTAEVFAVERHAADAAGRAMATRVEAGAIQVLDSLQEASDERP